MAIPILALALSTFEDATHGNRCEEGQSYALDKGRFVNFEAAGLMRKLTDAEIAALPRDGDIAPPTKSDPPFKVDGHTIKITGPVTLEGNLTVPAKPAMTKPKTTAKRTRAAK